MKTFEEKLWTEKYRPRNIADMILPKDLKKTFSEMVQSGSLHNMIFAGSSGLGKTTAARALCETIGCDYILINSSEENGIDVLRNKIKQFASTLSLSGGYKVVILDESDYLSASTQPALRGFIEEFSNNCRFIFTCNFKNRIIEPLHSRCAVIEFNTNKKTLASLAAEFMKRLTVILKAEGVAAEEAVLAEIIMKHAPDWRRILGECQRYAKTGGINSSVLTDDRDANIATLLQHLKDKDFKNMRAWVANHGAVDTTALYRRVYDALGDHAAPQSIPAIVCILADYSYKAAFVADKELNTVACFTEIMSNSNWK